MLKVKPLSIWANFSNIYWLLNDTSSRFIAFVNVSLNSDKVGRLDLLLEIWKWINNLIQKKYGYTESIIRCRYTITMPTYHHLLSTYHVYVNIPIIFIYKSMILKRELQNNVNIPMITIIIISFIVNIPCLNKNTNNIHIKINNTKTIISILTYYHLLSTYHDYVNIPMIFIFIMSFYGKKLI